jgi:hypothetical protein
MSPISCYVFPAPADPQNKSSTLPMRLTQLSSRHCGRGAFATTLCTSPKAACRWWVPTREEVGGHSGVVIQTTNVPGTDVLTETLRKGISGGDRLRGLSPHDLVAPLVAAVLLAMVSSPHPLGRLGLKSDGRRRESALP